MNASLLASILAGAMIFAGIGLAVLGLWPRPAPPARPTRPLRIPAWIARMPRWRRLAAVAALVIGVVLGTATGWVILIIALPLAVVGLPVLLATSDAAPRIARMEAIAEWTRNLSGVLTAGQGMEQALQASLRSTPDAIHPEVAQLVGRLRARWSTEAALRALADDLDDATGDLVVAALILGSRKRGDGIARVLTGLAESVAEDVRVRRQLEAERAKPRSSARTTSLISLGALTVFALSGQFLAPYGSPLGQALLALYLAAYVGCALWLRKLAAEPAAVRFVARRTEATR
jgi:Flp pilus assembly protein TadB